MIVQVDKRRRCVRVAAHNRIARAGKVSARQAAAIERDAQQRGAQPFFGSNGQIVERGIAASHCDRHEKSTFQRKRCDDCTNRTPGSVYEVETKMRKTQKNRSYYPELSPPKEHPILSL